MKISFFVLILSFFALSSAYAGTQTLVTYYPAPSGNYNTVTVNSLRFMPKTLAEIQSQYQCSYDPVVGWPPCPAGIEFYNTDAHSVYLSDGTHWRSVDASCVPVHSCSGSNCGTDDCGMSCGVCISPSSCSSSLPGTPGRCT